MKQTHKRIKQYCLKTKILKYKYENKITKNLAKYLLTSNLSLLMGEKSFELIVKFLEQ